MVILTAIAVSAIAIGAVNHHKAKKTDIANCRRCARSSSGVCRHHQRELKKTGKLPPQPVQPAQQPSMNGYQQYQQPPMNNYPPPPPMPYGNTANKAPDYTPRRSLATDGYDVPPPAYEQVSAKPAGPASGRRS